MTHIVLKGLPGLSKEELFQLINEFVDTEKIVTAHGGFDLDWRTAMEIIKRFADILDGPDKEAAEVEHVEQPMSDGDDQPQISYAQATRRAASRARRGA